MLRFLTMVPQLLALAEDKTADRELAAKAINLAFAFLLLAEVDASAGRYGYSRSLWQHCSILKGRNPSKNEPGPPARPLTGSGPDCFKCVLQRENYKSLPGI
jgi:hypothetical protein